MATTSSSLAITLEFLVAPADVRAILLRAATPAAEANHLVVLGPSRKRIVSGVYADKTTTVAYIVYEIATGRRRPGFAVVIRNHHIVIGELRLEGGHITCS